MHCTRCWRNNLCESRSSIKESAKVPCAKKTRRDKPCVYTWVSVTPKHVWIEHWWFLTLVSHLLTTGGKRTSGQYFYMLTVPTTWQVTASDECQTYTMCCTSTLGSLHKSVFLQPLKFLTPHNLDLKLLWHKTGSMTLGSSAQECVSIVWLNLMSSSTPAEGMPKARQTTHVPSGSFEAQCFSFLCHYGSALQGDADALDV